MAQKLKMKIDIILTKASSQRKNLQKLQAKLDNDKAQLEAFRKQKRPKAKIDEIASRVEAVEDDVDTIKKVLKEELKDVDNIIQEETKTLQNKIERFKDGKLIVNTKEAIEAREAELERKHDEEQ